MHPIRYHILQQFNKGMFDYLIATDEPIIATAKVETEAEEGDGDGEKKKKKKRAKKAQGNKDEEYGVSRGVDFREVSAGSTSSFQNAFTSSEVLLLCTHPVVNFDFPQSAKAYVHRVGRTARGTASGMAISFVAPDDTTLLEQVSAHLAGASRHTFSSSLVGTISPIRLFRGRQEHNPLQLQDEHGRRVPLPRGRYAKVCPCTLCPEVRPHFAPTGA